MVRFSLFKSEAIAKLGRQLISSGSQLTAVGVVAIASLCVSSILVGVRQLGITQPLELAAYDRMVQWHPPAKLDSRLLIVAITEKDIRAQKQWPISDLVMARVLSTLQSHSPKIIGLDLYRDLPVPPGHEQLVAQLHKPNVIAISNLTPNPIDKIPSPPSLPPERVGFNTFPVDPDAVVRRNLLFGWVDGKMYYSFSLRLALGYLAAQGINIQASADDSEILQLGKAVFTPLETNVGGYENIDAAGYQVLLNYRSRNNFARQVTLTQVLNGEVNPSWIKDKVILIGSTAPSLKDFFLTPYSPSLSTNHKMTGVGIHAQMVSQIIDAATGERPLFSFWTEAQEILWIASWTVISAILSWKIRHPLGLGLTCILMLGVLAGSCFYLFSQQSIWIPVASPGLAFLVTGGVVVALRADRAQRQKQMVMTLLGQNTSTEIANALWNKRNQLVKSGKLPGQVLTATMLFADIKDFSTVAEQILPEVLLEWVNELLNVLAEEVQAHHGIINKFTGDGLMAVFGVPVVRTLEAEIAQDAQAAVDCALAISDRLSQLNSIWLARDFPMIQMRVGICTGEVVAGSLGGKNRLEYGVLGDSVNIAARLESFAKERQPSDCRILIADSTLAYLGDTYEVESWGSALLKGRKQSVEVYRVVGRMG